MREVDSWTQAVYVAAPVICGRRLLPFSLAHSMLLRAIGNPYAYRGVEATREELLAAVLICSRTREENRAALFAGGQRAGALLRWSWRWRKMSLATADASFRQYIKDHTRFAPHHELAEAPDAHEPAAPFEFHLHRHLCVNEGMGDEEAWNCGMGYARHLFDCWAESQGSKSLMSEYDQRMQELNKAMNAAHAAGNATERDRLFELMGAETKRHKEARRG